MYKKLLHMMIRAFALQQTLFWAIYIEGSKICLIVQRHKQLYTKETWGF